MTWKEFLSMSLDETGELHEKAGYLCAPLLDESWNRGMKQAIICDGQIIYETQSNEMLSERVKQEAERRNKPCYAFFAPPRIEESVSPWSHVVLNDYYPTLPINLSPPEADDVERNHVSISADFDTGNPDFKAFDADRIGNLLGDLHAWERHVSRRHPGGELECFRKRAKVWVKDETGVVHGVICDDIELVRRWRRSTLVTYSGSGNRVGFVSRDLLCMLKVRVQFNPTWRVTEIYKPSS